MLHYANKKAMTREISHSTYAPLVAYAKLGTHPMGETTNTDGRYHLPKPYSLHLHGILMSLIFGVRYSDPHARYLNESRLCLFGIKKNPIVLASGP